MRTIQAFGTFERITRVIFNREFEEYVVRVYINGKHYAPADYFTDDKADAISNARVMLQG